MRLPPFCSSILATIWPPPMGGSDAVAGAPPVLVPMAISCRDEGRRVAPDGTRGFSNIALCDYNAMIKIAPVTCLDWCQVILADMQLLVVIVAFY
jgi:hypothetical protein